jgi:hypothetical protein
MTQQNPEEESQSGLRRRAVTGILKDPLSLLAYNTLLRPFASARANLGSLAQVRPAATRLLQERLRCLNRLRKANWGPLESAKKFIYAANCMPWRLSVSGPVTRYCNHWAVCPWCWGGKRVLPVWDGLRRCGKLQTQHQNHSGMFSFREEWLFRNKPRRGPHPREYSPVDVVKFLDVRLKVIGQVLGGDWSIGWVACGHVYPGRAGGYVSRTWAWVVPGDDFDLPVAGRVLRMRVCQVSKVDEISLARILGRELRFRRAMTRGEPEAVKRCLEAVAGVRLLRSGGAVWKTTPEES